ncbi:glycosyltransferase family 25 protein [Cercospora zeae-maydis SCOH1-5]|uniref:Glycosyltransferase family 25 protein n=1 Tax=Cercospora zeae-maydis SCOH1-5 TaxID=717836 RepID=A0A6A6F992_9PEZI|nr:glycosyltransferase family 25 protein [Cercospora zeae-maydis SCOH1-5]
MARRTNDPRKTPTIMDDVQNATLGFQKMFVVNLPTRYDRRDAMSLAAALTGLQVEYIDGQAGVDRARQPPGGSEVEMPQGSFDSWRAHMDVMRRIVEDNIQSALVLEDDVDWDVRIKSQMQDFARGSQMLIQPLQGTTDQYLDPTINGPTDEHEHSDFAVGDAVIEESVTSPYGDLDRWDLLWIGHCGCQFPMPEDHDTPLGRVVFGNDHTVPTVKQIDIELGHPQLIDEYPDHTRVVSRARMHTCTLGYGVSQLGARRLLYELAVHAMTGTNDMMFRSACHGSDGRRAMNCLTVQPPLFEHHRQAGNKSLYSDIDKHEGYNEEAFTPNVRWSTRLNFDTLAAGLDDYLDSYPDP